MEESGHGVVVPVKIAKGAVDHFEVANLETDPAVMHGDASSHLNRRAAGNVRIQSGCEWPDAASVGCRIEAAVRGWPPGRAS